VASFLRQLDGDLFLRTFVTILVIMDPVGTIPVFLGLTRGADARARRRAALQATGVAASVILGFAVFGQQVLRLLGISIEALQVSGGLILVLVALELLQPSSSSGGVLPSAAGTNVALVPLGTPLLAGPGAIAATMVYIREASNAGETVSVVVALLAALAVLALALRYSGIVARLLRPNGIELLTRVVGLLLAAIAVQLVAVGIESWVRGGV
jgi:multiple antibiotic resistance protein